MLTRQKPWSTAVTCANSHFSQKVAAAPAWKHKRAQDLKWLTTTCTTEQVHSEKWWLGQQPCAWELGAGWGTCSSPSPDARSHLHSSVPSPATDSPHNLRSPPSWAGTAMLSWLGWIAVKRSEVLGWSGLGKEPFIIKFLCDLRDEGLLEWMATGSALTCFDCAGSFFCSFFIFFGTFLLWYFWLSLELSFCLSLRVATWG